MFKTAQLGLELLELELLGLLELGLLELGLLDLELLELGLELELELEGLLELELELEEELELLELLLLELDLLLLLELLVVSLLQPTKTATRPTTKSAANNFFIETTVLSHERDIPDGKTAAGRTTRHEFTMKDSHAVHLFPKFWRKFAECPEGSRKYLRNTP